jgi:uncharacterized protein YeaO (DUF488 family)
VPIRVVQLGVTPRTKDEGLRLGTVRRPPRGVPKSEFATRDFYDLWMPDLSPSAALVGKALTAKSSADWAAFERKFVAEMKRPEAARLLDLLAALSHQTSFAVGCYCDVENRCHRSVLRQLLKARGAEVTEA